MLNSFLKAVLRFQEDIIGIDVPKQPTLLSEQRALARVEHIQEELAELLTARTKENSLEEQADAFIDVIYVALGGLIEMGVTPGPVFNEVQRANMEKISGDVSSRPSNLGFDAIKPEGWNGPDVAKAMLALTPEVIDSMSPVYKEIAELRAKKGADYNSCVQLQDYFPLGHLSYFQMVYLKAKRMHSLIDVMSQGGTPNFEGLRDTLLDAMNYITFWIEAIDKGEV